MQKHLNESLFAEIEARLPDMPGKQVLLSRAILEAPELIAFGSIRELSSKLGMNSATVIRFAKSLGFSGYQELQGAIRELYLARAGLTNTRRTSAENGENSAAETFRQQLSNLETARAHLSEMDLDQVADTLLNARNIFVCTTGSAIVPGMILERLLRHVGLRGQLVSGSSVDRLIALHDLSSEDVVIVIGLWLTFRESLQALSIARRNQSKTISIVGSTSSPLSQATDHTLLAPSAGASLTFSVVAPVAVVEALVAHVARRQPDRQQAVEQILHDLYLEEDLLAPAFLSVLEGVMDFERQG